MSGVVGGARCECGQAGVPLVTDAQLFHDSLQLFLRGEQDHRADRQLLEQGHLELRQHVAWEADPVAVDVGGVAHRCPGRRVEEGGVDGRETPGRPSVAPRSAT